jgi:hypothetical protein
VKCAIVLVAALAFTGAGCGYADNNARAAAMVAQAYLNAFAAQDAPAICRVLAPEVVVALAAGRTCEERVQLLLHHPYPRLTVGRVRIVSGPPLNPRFAVAVPAQHGRWITVGRYGSIWRVIDGGLASRLSSRTTSLHCAVAWQAGAQHAASCITVVRPKTSLTTTSPS